VNGNYTPHVIPDDLQAQAAIQGQQDAETAREKMKEESIRLFKTSRRNALKMQQFLIGSFVPCMGTLAQHLDPSGYCVLSLAVNDRCASSSSHWSKGVTYIDVSCEERSQVRLLYSPSFKIPAGLGVSFQPFFRNKEVIHKKEVCKREAWALHMDTPAQLLYHGEVRWQAFVDKLDNVVEWRTRFTEGKMPQSSSPYMDELRIAAVMLTKSHHPSPLAMLGADDAKRAACIGSQNVTTPLDDEWSPCGHVHSFVIRFQKRESVDPNPSALGMLLKAHQDMDKLSPRAHCKAKEQSEVGKPAHPLQLNIPATRLRLENLTIASEHPLYKATTAEPPNEAKGAIFDRRVLDNIPEANPTERLQSESYEEWSKSVVRGPLTSNEEKKTKAGAAVPLPSQRFPLAPDHPLYKGAMAEPPDASTAAAASRPPRPLDQLPSPRFPLDPEVIAAYKITQEEYGLLANEYLRRKGRDPDKAIDEVLDQINPDNAPVHREIFPAMFVERGQDGNQVYLCDWQGLMDKAQPRGEGFDIVLHNG
jgi:hypothetical protein